MHLVAFTLFYRYAGNEAQTQENICTALVKLATQLPLATRRRCRRHIKLKKSTAKHQRHLAQVRHILGADNNAARIGVCVDDLYDITDLVNSPAIRLWPTAPLHATHQDRRPQAPIRSRLSRHAI